MINTRQAHLEVVLDEDKLGLVHAVAVREAAVVHQTNQSGADGVDSRESRDRGGLAHGQRAEGRQDGANHDLEDHQDPMQHVDQLEAQRVLGPLDDHVPVEPVWEAPGRPVPARGVDDLVLLALADGADAVGDAGPLGGREEAVASREVAGLGMRLRLGRGRALRRVAEGRLG